MNQEIAAKPSWGRLQILERADRLAERVIGHWPGPNSSLEEASVAATWARLDRVLAEIPSGAWTTYGDLAAVVGTHAVPLGQRLANRPAPNAHRVLQSEGTISPGFHWLDPSRDDQVQLVLEAEGVVFDAQGRASPGQRLHAEDLATLAGMETELAEPDSVDVDENGRRDRFYAQLGELQPAHVVGATHALLDAWVHLGGTLQFGSSEETSCFVMPAVGHPSPWPFTIYPSGKVEVVFQHMANRPPFDDAELRVQFQKRLDSIQEIDIPSSKIALRPGFPLRLLVDAGIRDRVIEALAWYLDQLASSDATTT